MNDVAIITDEITSGEIDELKQKERIERRRYY
jgi:hypothetical protein